MIILISMTIYRYAEYAVAIYIVTYRLSTRLSPASRRDLSLFRNVLSPPKPEVHRNKMAKKAD